ncbi:MAG: hypothetical protein LLG06_11720 [Desulfobacteraceae bacterium]|nr:hypothetical protein [Desulfobacteraceae bacterium]
MEHLGIGLDGAIKLVSNFGIPGLVLILWYLSDKSHERTLAQYREDTTQQRKTYEDGLKEVREMYEHNVLLVKDYQSLSRDLKDIIVMNTQTLTRLSDDINRNQFCPEVRLKKEAQGVQR